MVLVSVLSFLLIYRHYGGYYYRSTMAKVLLFFVSVYGFIIACILTPLRCTHLINYSVAKVMRATSQFWTGLEVDCEGLELLDQIKGPAIYVCNHQSSLDVMLIGVAYRKNTSIVAKKELKSYPFLGWFMTMSNAIFLDRKNRDSAVKEAKQAAADIHKKGINVWVFPEGTRGHESEVTLLPFKKGPFYMAVQARVPIVPVVLANYYNLYSAKEKRFNPGTVKCRILPPISTKDVLEESSEVQKLADSCREQMLIALKEISPQKKADK
ncbi:uncharacterized protein EV154DRAFT_424738 [Mucor mucedo]|uniref:uncharacterized protein n=1 Tax=Mucor mucedo TaxID=29922 RepID=UPI00221EBCF6|nr:uncharacterized protein EV154DRAFT_424738 [Mucor mucedo]KAI7888983.1 hypothetical protein EV154DRAFT_424738 [Mucor mucedo]